MNRKIGNIKTKPNIMKITGIIFLCCCLFFVSTGCFYDKADQVYPQSTCDTTNVTLSVELNDILSANCFRCHSSVNAPINGGNYNLQDYATIHNAAVNGLLLSSIQQDNKLAPPMPQDGGKLSDCEISKFAAWVDKGAPNN
jgi:hypothetical protein